jgi:hypothetical protein
MELCRNILLSPRTAILILLMSWTFAAAKNPGANHQLPSEKKTGPGLNSLNYVMKVHAGQHIIINGERIFHGDVFIEGNGILTVTGTLRFDQNCKIIVAQNGRLIIDGGILSSISDKSWKGVEVWGTRNRNQLRVNGNCSQGFIELKNGALIENAKTAVALWHPKFLLTSGGIIRAENSWFKNNGKAIEFISYHNYNQKTLKRCGNLSSIFNCSFITTGQYAGASPFVAFITMWDTEGISITGCSFVNSKQEEEFENRGYGIFSEDAQYKVSSFIRNNPPGSCDSVIRPLFQGLTIGINAQSDTVQGSISINNSVFLVNTIGIRLRNVDSSTVSGSSFTIGANPFCTGSPGTGIEVIACRGTIIMENGFYTRNKQFEPDFSIGIHSLCPLNCRNDFCKRDGNYFDRIHAVFQSEDTDPDNQNKVTCYIPASLPMVIDFLKPPPGLSVYKLPAESSDPGCGAPCMGLINDPPLTGTLTEGMRGITFPGDLLYSKSALQNNYMQPLLPYSSIEYNMMSDQVEPVDLPTGSVVGEFPIDKKEEDHVVVSKIIDETSLLRRIEYLKKDLVENKKIKFWMKKPELKELTAIAQYNTGIAGVKAKNILGFFFGKEFIDCPQLFIPSVCPSTSPGNK